MCAGMWPIQHGTNNSSCFQIQGAIDDHTDELMSLNLGDDYF